MAHGYRVGKSGKLGSYAGQLLAQRNGGTEAVSLNNDPDNLNRWQRRALNKAKRKLPRATKGDET